MVKKSICYYFFIVFFVFCASLQAQNYKKTTIAGKEFYQYQVEKSEGFYSITRKFGVTQDELIKYNPELKDGLKVDQIIFIPIKNETAPTPAPAASLSPLPAQLERATIEHIVDKKETVYSISKMYHVDIDTIYKYNPEAKTKIKKGDVIKFPVRAIRRDDIKKQDSEQQYNLHVVVQKETVFGISRQYGLSVEELYGLNPELQKNGLKTGDVIKVSRKQIEAAPVVEQPQVKQSGSALRVAFLLPFMLDAEKTIAVSSNRFYDFYQGALMAIDSLRKTGVSVDVYTFDTNRNAEKLKSILLSPELKTVDLIIGPAYTDQIKPVADFAKANNIRMVVPFSSQTPETATNEYLFQYNTSQLLLNEETIDIFINTFKNKNIVLLKFQDPPAVSVKNFTDSLAKRLNEKGIAFKEKRILNDSIPTFSLNNFLVNNKENIVLLATSNMAVLGRILPVLNNAEKEFSLFGFPEWVQYGRAKDEIFIRDTYIASPFFLDMQNNNVSRFFADYYENFGNENTVSLPYYNLLGYDITFYFLTGIKKFGQNFEKNLNKANTKPLQGEFKFEKINGGGYMNKNQFLIKYRGDSKKKLNP